MEREIDKKNLVLKEDESIGTVQIADDVVAMIASLAATEVDGWRQRNGRQHYQRTDEQSRCEESDQGRKSRGSGQERNGRSGSDHGIRIQYSRNLSGSTAEGEKRH